MKRALIAFFLVACIGAASARVMIPPEMRPPTQYLEIVREKGAPCSSECFIEFILLSNGVLVRKQFDSPKYDETTPAFDLRRMDMQAAGALLAQAGAFLGKEQPPSGSHTDPNNLYFYDGEKHYAWSSKQQVREFSSLYDTMQFAYAEAKMAEDFYLHQYYQPLAGGTQALHIFADGTIISSVFDRLSYRMTGTSIARLTDEDLAKTKTLAASAQNAPAGRFTKCAADTGIEYGLVEFFNGSNVLKSYTCGSDNDAVTVLFNHVKNLSRD